MLYAVDDNNDKDNNFNNYNNNSTKSTIDLRQEAEYRVIIKKINNDNNDAIQIINNNNKKKKPKNIRNSLLFDASDMSKNKTPHHAKLLAVDYKVNGIRARVNSGEFMPPRWVTDDETSKCMICYSLFDWFNRRHHCRHCGYIVCDTCSNHRCLLPLEYGEGDPQRVCKICYKDLLPKQSHLTDTIANHLRSNQIDTTKCAVRYLNMPFSFTLGSEIRKASYSTYNLFESNWIKDRSILLQLIPKACGIAFLTVAKGGFGLAAKIGTGLVISRLQDGEWSAPSAIGTVGISWGMLIGAELTDYVILLNTKEAVNAFSGYGQVVIGAGLEVAVGPIGRTGTADINIGTLGFAPAFSYSHSRGLYAGLSLDGSVIISRPDVNFKFYGKSVTPFEILNGAVARPRAAMPLYDALENALSAYPNPKYN